MTDFGKSYSRIPSQVYARQWTPYSTLPFVDNSFVEIPEPQEQKQFSARDILDSGVDSYLKPHKLIKACLYAFVTLSSGERKLVKPLDYVLYSIAQIPIAVMSDDKFKAEYTDGFSLCQTCSAKAQISAIVASIEAGNSVTLDDGTVLKTVEDLEAFKQKIGI